MTTTRHHQFTVADHPRLEVELTSGDLRVRNGAPGTIALTVETSDADQVEVSQIGDTVTVHRPRNWSGRRRRVSVVATVPAGTDLAVTSVSAEVRLEGDYGATTIRTISGDVAVDRIGRGELGSTSGDLELRVTGALDVSTVSGDVTVGHVQGRLKASLTSGELRAERVDGDAEVASMSGDVVIGRCDGDEVHARSVSGDLRIGLPAGIRVDPDISTVSGSTSLPKGPPQVTDGPRRRVRLRLRTVSGDIRLERA